MAVKEHQLYNEVWENVMVWALPKIKEDLERVGYQLLFERDSGYQLSPKQQYEYNSYYWCRKLEQAFDRLENIKSMTGHSLYKKKGEQQSVLLQDWIMYNYEHYTVVYQGTLDIALLLTSEIFDLGIPYKKCSYGMVCDNTRVNGTSVHSILEKLRKATSKHREGKNLLLHRGERIELPLETEILGVVDATNMAIKLGWEASTDVKQALIEFLAIHARQDLLTIMDKECTEIELLVEKLFDKLLPYYRKMHSFYSYTETKR